MNTDEDTVTFFHYTDEKGVKAIQDTGMIRPSQDTVKDAMHGSGVYGTRIGPDAGRKQIAANNWDGIAVSREQQGKTDYAVKLEIPKDKVDHFAVGGRDILVHKDTIKLKDYPHEIILVKKSAPSSP